MGRTEVERRGRRGRKSENEEKFHRLVFRVTHRASDGSEPTKITSNPSIPTVCRFSSCKFTRKRERERKKRDKILFEPDTVWFWRRKRRKKKLAPRHFASSCDWLIGCSDSGHRLTLGQRRTASGKCRWKFGQLRPNSVNIEQPRTIYVIISPNRDSRLYCHFPNFDFGKYIALTLQRFIT